MEGFLGVVAVIVLLVICATEKKGGTNQGKQYRRSDLVFGREGDGRYCVYCCSEGFAVVFRGTLSECEEFMSNAIR